MRRRDVITLFGSALAAYPTATAAQQTAGMRRVGVLLAGSGNATANGGLAAFRQGLVALGWTEGRNLVLDVRAGNRGANLTALASELVALKPQVILAFASPSVIALRHVAGAIPIVFVNVSDPVAQGFVRDLGRPGGTVTGFANYDYAMAGKWFQLLRDIAPHIKRTIVLYDPKTPSWPGFFRAIQSAGKAASVDTVAIVFQNGGVPQVAALGTGPGSGLILLPGAGIPGAQDALIKNAATLRLPVMSAQPFFTTRGGLMSYTFDLNADVRLAASYVDRILRGAKPGDLPVQDPTSFVLSINLKTAKALGLTVPESLLVSANELIR